jgi:hypothetical protein
MKACGGRTLSMNIAISGTGCRVRSERYTEDENGISIIHALYTVPQSIVMIIFSSLLGLKSVGNKRGGRPGSTIMGRSKLS